MLQEEELTAGPQDPNDFAQREFGNTCIFRRMRGRLGGRRRVMTGGLAALTLVLAACTPTERASVASDGAEGNGVSDVPSLSHDGRYLAFESSASNLVPGDTNNVSDVFVRDLVAKTVVRVSVNSSGAQANRNSSGPRIDDSGQFVAFTSDSTTFAGTSALWVYVHNMKTGVTEPISPADNVDLDLSGSSRYVAVVISGNVDVYDRYARTLDSSTGPGSKPRISDNGRYVTFTRPSAGLEDATDIFVRDRVAGTTTQVPFPSPSTDYPDFISGSDPQISGNGRYVAYTERELLNLEPPDTFDYRYRIYVYDRQAGTLERADVRSDVTPGDGQTGEVHAISNDGRDVMFRSSELVPNETFGDHEYVRDRVAHKTYLVDRNQNEQIANGYSGYGSDISGDGNRIALSSQATNLVPNDTNNTIDVFVRSFPGAPPP